MLYVDMDKDALSIKIEEQWYIWLNIEKTHLSSWKITIQKIKRLKR